MEVSKRINVSKLDGLRECIVCHRWYFLKMSFKFQLEVCTDCHDKMQKAVNFNDAPNVTVKEIIIEFILNNI